MAVEDVIYGFLSQDEPISAIAPNHTLLVDSLSKRVAPGLTLGFVAAPIAWADRMVAAVRSGSWAATGLPLACALQVMASPIAGKLVAGKQADARERQLILNQVSLPSSLGH